MKGSSDSSGGSKSVISKVIFAILAIAALTVFSFLPVTEGLDPKAMVAVGLLLFNILLWVGNVLPKAAIGLLVLALLPLLGVNASISETLGNFINTALFIILAAFAISTMIESTKLPKWLMTVFLKVFKSSTKAIVLAFMLATAICSSVMSDFAACALYGSIAFAIAKNEELSAHIDRKFVKCLTIGIPIAALAGGTMTPVGCPANIVVMNLLHTTTSMDVSFLQWMTVGIPISLIAVILAWCAIIIAHRPKNIAEEDLVILRETFFVHEKLGKREWKAIAMLVLMLGFWIAGGWVKALDAAVVAMLGTAVMLFPKIGFFTWKEFQTKVPWDLIIMVGSLLALAQPLLKTGVVTWFVGVVIGDATSWSPFMVLFISSAIVVVLRALIPSGSPVVVIAVPAFATLALATGLNPMCIVMAMSVWSQITLLIPILDAMFLITYDEGQYYGVFDVFKFGLPLSIVLLVIDSTLIPPLVALAGL